MRIDFTTDPQALVPAAAAALLAREPLDVALPDTWERPENWPVPIKKVPRGTPNRVQSYRPVAILEFAELVLSSRANRE